MERHQQLLDLLAPALGAESASDLTKQYNSNMVSAGACLVCAPQPHPTCCSLVRDTVSEALGDACWFPACRKPLAHCLQSNLDHIVAMELWWRTAALQALLAYVQVAAGWPGCASLKHNLAPTYGCLACFVCRHPEHAELLPTA